MIEKRSPQIAARLEAICGQVRMRADVDEAVQRELLGHMQDKLLAYVNGHERLSEEDALLLVERHFGDMAVVRDLLREVHAPSLPPLERILLPIAVSSLARIPVILWNSFWPHIDGRSPPIVGGWGVGLVLEILALPVAAACLILLGRRYAAGRQPISSWTRSQLIGATAAAFAAFVILHWVSVNWLGNLAGSMGVLSWWPLETMAWIWYADRFRGRMPTVLVVACSWAVFVILGAATFQFYSAVSASGVYSPRFAPAPLQGAYDTLRQVSNEMTRKSVHSLQPPMMTEFLARFILLPILWYLLVSWVIRGFQRARAKALVE